MGRKKKARTGTVGREVLFSDRADATLVIKVGDTTIYDEKGPLKRESAFVKTLLEADAEGKDEQQADVVHKTIVTVPDTGPSADSIVHALCVLHGRSGEGGVEPTVCVDNVAPLLEAARYLQLDTVIDACSACVSAWLVAMPDATEDTDVARKEVANLLGEMLSLSAEYKLEAFSSLVRFLRAAMPEATLVRQELRVGDFANKAMGVSSCSEAFSFDGHRYKLQCEPRHDDEGRIGIFLSLCNPGDEPVVVDATFRVRHPTGGDDLSDRSEALSLIEETPSKGVDFRSTSRHSSRNTSRAHILSTYVATDGSVTVSVDVRKTSSHLESIAKMALRSPGYLALDDSNKLAVASAMLSVVGVVAT